MKFLFLSVRRIPNSRWLGGGGNGFIISKVGFNRNNIKNAKNPTTFWTEEDGGRDEWHNGWIGNQDKWKLGRIILLLLLLLLLLKSLDVQIHGIQDFIFFLGYGIIWRNETSFFFVSEIFPF